MNYKRLFFIVLTVISLLVLCFFSAHQYDLTKNYIWMLVSFTSALFDFILVVLFTFVNI